MLQEPKAASSLQQHSRTTDSGRRQSSHILSLSAGTTPAVCRPQSVSPGICSTCGNVCAVTSGVGWYTLPVFGWSIAMIVVIAGGGSVRVLVVVQNTWRAAHAAPQLSDTKLYTLKTTAVNTSHNTAGNAHYTSKHM